jgi:hypothetical protein
MKQVQSYSDGSVTLAVSSSAEDAISSARGRLADERGAQEINNDNQYTNPHGDSRSVIRTGIGWSEELVAQIQKRLVVGGLGTEAFVYGIRGC